MKNAKNRQEGWSVNQLIIWILTFIFALSVFFKLGPIYLDEYTGVKGVMKSLGKEDLTSVKKSELKSKIDKFLTINNIRGEAAKVFNVKKDTKGGYLITANYERRVNMFGNLDVVVAFENELHTKDTPVYK